VYRPVLVESTANFSVNLNTLVYQEKTGRVLKQKALTKLPQPAQFWM
jgi:hypothetical protein